jgi:hypothetical protein
MSADDTIIIPEDDSFAPAEQTEAEILAEDELIEAELWETFDDRVPAPFIAGSYTAETLQSNLSAVGMVTADDMQANLSAVGLAKTDWFESIGSAVGAAIIDGDAEVSASAVPLLIAKGDADFHQAYASAVVAGGTVRVHQGGSPLMIAKRMKVEQGGGVVMIASKAKVKRGFIGVLFAREAQLSEDTRVFVTGKGAAFISAAVFGGFAVLAFALLGGLSGLTRRRR